MHLFFLLLECFFFMLAIDFPGKKRIFMTNKTTIISLFFFLVGEALARDAVQLVCLADSCQGMLPEKGPDTHCWAAAGSCGAVYCRRNQAALGYI